MRSIRNVGLPLTPRYPNSFDTRYWYRIRRVIAWLGALIVVAGACWNLRLGIGAGVVIGFWCLCEIRQNGRRIELMELYNQVRYEALQNHLKISPGELQRIVENIRYHADYDDRIRLEEDAARVATRIWLSNHWLYWSLRWDAAMEAAGDENLHSLLREHGLRAMGADTSTESKP